MAEETQLPESAFNEKILVYLGSSLRLTKAKEILPDAIYRPPAKQGDIVSDVVNLNPDRIILADGCFHQNLSVWHKELVYALQYPSVKAVYGASSMGALRAAELDYLGMIGIGQIYEWFRDGVIEDDAEVALNYADKGPDYIPLTIPLVDIRAGVEHYEREFPGQPVAKSARKFMEAVARVYYMDRTPGLCEETWKGAHGVTFPFVPQKELDAIQALSTFRRHHAKPIQKPAPEDLTMFFRALYERDRRIRIKGQEVPQQHIDAYVTLHNPEYERICWDAANQELALMLCDKLQVQISILELNRESERFQIKCGLKTKEDLTEFLSANGWSLHEFDRLMIQNCRIRKLQHCLSVTKSYRRNTQSILDYLRTHQGFEYWADLAMAAEEKIKQSGVDDWMGINVETPVLDLLAKHMEKEGLELKCNSEEYLLETGFANLSELGVALSRTLAGKEQ